MYLVESILSDTAEIFERTPEELVSRSRKRAIVEARQAAMWALRQRYPSFSLELIGSALGGRHYSTVAHALATVEERAKHNDAYRSQLQQLLARISPGGSGDGAKRCGSVSVAGQLT